MLPFLRRVAARGKGCRQERSVCVIFSTQPLIICMCVGVHSCAAPRNLNPLLNLLAYSPCGLVTSRMLYILSYLVIKICLTHENNPLFAYLLTSDVLEAKRKISTRDKRKVASDSARLLSITRGIIGVEGQRCRTGEMLQDVGFCLTRSIELRDGLWRLGWLSV